MLLQNWLKLIWDCADCKKGSAAPPLALLHIWSHGELEGLKIQAFFVGVSFQSDQQANLTFHLTTITSSDAKLTAETKTKKRMEENNNNNNEDF